MIRKIEFFKLFFLSVSFSFMACNADINLNSITGDISLDPSLIVPLGSASANIGDLLDSAKIDGIFYDSNAVINYRIYDTLPEFILPKIDFLKDIRQISKNFQIPYSPLPVPPNTTIVEEEYHEFMDLGVNTDTLLQRVDSIHVSDAVFSVKISVNNLNISPSNLMFTFSFADKMIMDNGGSNEIDFVPTQFNTAEDIAISNFKLNFSKGASAIPLIISLKAITGNLPLTLFPDSRISMEFNFKQLDWTLVYGKFDLSQIPIEGKIDLNLSSLFPKNLSVEFSNPQIEITTLSNLGIKMGLKLDYLKSIGSAGTVFARFDGKTSTYSEFNNKPTVPSEFVNNALPVFDSNWGETNKLLSQLPDTLAYKLSASSIKTLSPDFVTPDARIKVFMKSTIPLVFNAGSSLTHTDTISNFFDKLASQLDRYSQIDFESTKLILSVSNGLPIKTTLTLSFIDSTGIELPTDFEKNYSIDAGITDSNGMVQEGAASLKIITISLNKEQLTQLKRAVKLFYKIRIEANDLNSKLAFSKSNSLNLKVALFLKGNLKSSLNK